MHVTDLSILIAVCAGSAAEQQAGEKLLEHLAAEIEANSNIALRSVWKWTCYQV